MIRISELKMKPKDQSADLKEWTCRTLGIAQKDILDIRLVKESVDARKKPNIYFVRSLDITLANEAEYIKIWKRKKSEFHFAQAQRVSYSFPKFQKREEKIAIVGFGPAGLFCAYLLSMAGFSVELFERGKSVEERQKDVELFWKTGELNTQSNVSFGEGGAGTFSDGKLNTLVKDKFGRNQAVLDTFVQFGANPSIAYDAKPHIGTDVLVQVIRNMREKIQQLGGNIHFNSCLTDLYFDNNCISGFEINGNEKYSCKELVLAIGHSARDTFEMLYNRKLTMEQKAFAVGFRVEHPQDMINTSQYGENYSKSLPVAPYKLATKTSLGRNVYSFCMCPGGFVVNASSEKGKLAINGMSYSKRDGENANSAMIMNVEPEDFGSAHVLAGVEFQRKLEEKAYLLGEGKIPCQRFGDFKAAVMGESMHNDSDTKLMPQTKGEFCWANLQELLPEQFNKAFVEGMTTFGKQIKGFDRWDAVMEGIESRTSSPVRICRDETLQSNYKGIYPCGEGAGYAGGIMSAAMDGMKVAEMIIAKYSV